MIYKNIGKSASSVGLSKLTKIFIGGNFIPREKNIFEIFGVKKILGIKIEYHVRYSDIGISHIRSRTIGDKIEDRYSKEQLSNAGHPSWYLKTVM